MDYKQDYSKLVSSFPDTLTLINQKMFVVDPLGFRFEVTEVLPLLDPDTPDCNVGFVVKFLAFEKQPFFVVLSVFAERKFYCGDAKSISYIPAATFGDATSHQTGCFLVNTLHKSANHSKWFVVAVPVDEDSLNLASVINQFYLIRTAYFAVKNSQLFVFHDSTCSPVTSIWQHKKESFFQSEDGFCEKIKQTA